MKTKHIKRKGTLLSSVAMLGTAMLLTACGGDGGDSPVDDGGANPGESGAQALLYAYPDNGQAEISTAAPVVLRFSSAVNLGEAQNAITVYEGDAQTGTVVAVTPEPVAGEPNNVLLEPDQDLKPNQTYTVVIEGLRLSKGTAKDQTLTFTTRPLHEGPKNLVVKDDTFEVSRRMPDDSEMEPVMDFSSFRFQFTQPVDRATANYGEDPASTGPGGGTIPADSVVLRDSSGAPVPATLLIDGAYMTVDPEPDYLNAGETYTLDITADLASTYGEAFGAQSYTFTPKDSSPKGEPAILVQKLTQGSTSRLTGKPVNEVPVNGTLLGENDNITQASAEVVRAELADVTTYTDVTPIRLPKGTVLNGAEINPILIGGEVPAGFGSGDVTMTVLSDASGYLVPNPYAGNNPNALRIVHLMMDVGIATSEARANGAFTQDLLHIELVGLAEVDPTAGVLNLDAVSVVEPNILGQEYGYGMLSFQLQSYKDQNNPPEVADDTSAPVLQSSMLGTYSDEEYSVTRNKADLLRNSDAIVFNFNEALDAKSIDGNVALYENSAEIQANSYVDGAAIIIEPISPLKDSPAETPVDYQVELSTGISDLAGNTLQSTISESFEMARLVSDFSVVSPGSTAPGISLSPDEFRDAPAAPMILSAYPGYPCLLAPGTFDSANDVAGRCAGTYSDQQVDQIGTVDYQDLIPIQEHAANKPIIVQLSKPIDPETVSLGETFLVQEINGDGSAIPGSEVPGILSVDSHTITFYPDAPWEEGRLYSYALVSNGDATSSICPPSGSICGLTDQLPLKTEFLGEVTVVDVQDPNPHSVYPPERDTQISREFIVPDGGGREFIQYFKGKEDNNNVLQVLSTLPAVDENANLFHDVSTIISTFPPGLYASGTYQYTDEEALPENVVDPVAEAEIDPAGILAPPNSVKILSVAKDGLGATPAPVVNGGVVGCGYQSFIPDQDNPGQFISTAMECPDRKFSYLRGALTAEVTDEYVDGKGLKVLIWPAMLTGTSLDVVAKFLTIPNSVQAASGPQYLRMRYSNDEGPDRRSPIVGWINDDGDQPSLSASVDLYVEAPYVPLFAAPFPNSTHNFISYPISLNISGPLTFLDDGRMVVDQYNLEPVDLELRLNLPDGSWGGSQKLRIPERGNHLRYISSPVK